MLRGKTKKKTKKPLVTAQGHLMFWVFEGPVLANVRDLRDALKSMSDKTYVYHVNGDKNDFANWVCDILCDVDLGKKLARAKKRATALKMVDEHVKEHY